MPRSSPAGQGGFGDFAASAISAAGSAAEPSSGAAERRPRRQSPARGRGQGDRAMGSSPRFVAGRFARWYVAAPGRTRAAPAGRRDRSWRTIAAVDCAAASPPSRRPAMNVETVDATPCRCTPCRRSGPCESSSPPWIALPEIHRARALRRRECLRGAVDGRLLPRGRWTGLRDGARCTNGAHRPIRPAPDSHPRNIIGSDRSACSVLSPASTRPCGSRSGRLSCHEDRLRVCAARCVVPGGDKSR